MERKHSRWKMAAAFTAASASRGAADENSSGEGGIAIWQRSLSRNCLKPARSLRARNAQENYKASSAVWLLLS